MLLGVLFLLGEVAVALFQLNAIAPVVVVGPLVVWFVALQRARRKRLATRCADAASVCWLNCGKMAYGGLIHAP